CCVRSGTPPRELPQAGGRATGRPFENSSATVVRAAVGGTKTGTQDACHIRLNPRPPEPILLQGPCGDVPQRLGCRRRWAISDCFGATMYDRSLPGLIAACIVVC